MDGFVSFLGTAGCALLWLIVLAAAAVSVVLKLQPPGSTTVADLLGDTSMDALSRDLADALRSEGLLGGQATARDAGPAAANVTGGADEAGAARLTPGSPLESGWPTAEAIVPDGEAVGFGVLKESDPDFDADRFYLLVTRLFARAQYAVTAGDLGPMRAWADENAMRALQARVDGDDASGVRRELNDLEVESVRALAVDRDMPFERVHVRIVATAIPRVVDRATGRLVDPDRLGDGLTRRTVQEYWTLSRYAGAPHSDDRLPDTCPNCGGPLDGEDAGVCGYCGLHVNPEARGSGDWVVHAVSQA